MHLGNRYNSLRQVVCNYSRTAVYFEKFSVAFGHPLRGCYKSVYIIAVLIFNILLFCLNGYSETLTDCISSATSNTTVAIHVFVHLDKSKTKYRF